MTKKADNKGDASSDLAQLAADRERTDARLDEIAAERERVAHAALTGDASARERLQALRREAAELADHRQDLAAAVAEGERKVAAADAAERRREEVAAAERRKVLAGRLRVAGEEADRSARAFADALVEIDAISRDPAAAGVSHLEFGRMRVHVMDAAHAAFQPVHPFMRPEDRTPMPPAARRTFSQTLGGWAREIDSEADRVIAGNNQTNKEAA